VLRVAILQLSPFLPSAPARESIDRPGRRGYIKAMRVVHEYRPLPAEKRPQDPHLDGRGLRFEALEHGGTHPGHHVPPGARAARVGHR
jgi:hypothetical protein